jgi:hypothetical protein
LKTVNITPAGAMIDQARHSIPDYARVTLDRYANNRVKELKLVTKAFKYSFPFYGQIHTNRSFGKLFEIIQKVIKARIPYVESAKVPFMELTTRSHGIYSFKLYVGPYRDRTEARPIIRYIRYLHNMAGIYSVPVVLGVNVLSHVVIPEGMQAYTMAADEIRANTYEVAVVTAELISSRAENGYLLLYYVEQIIKCIETLHRRAHYVESTHRAII